jgi:Tfp pilus assembly protein PilF
LGAVLLDLGQAAQAEAVYRRDLEEHPKNGWSLFGLARSLEAQSRAADAQWAGTGFRAAWARADVELESSRF